MSRTKHNVYSLVVHADGGVQFIRNFQPSGPIWHAKFASTQILVDRMIKTCFIPTGNNKHYPGAVNYTYIGGRK